MFDTILINDMHASPCHRALQATAQSTAELADCFAAALTVDVSATTEEHLQSLQN